MSLSRGTEAITLHGLPVLLFAGILAAIAPCDHVQAGGFRSPEECLAYTGDAHLNCLYAYIEIQRDKIAKLEEELKTQKATVQQLQEQVNRQASITQQLQRGGEDRDEKVKDFNRFQVVPFLGFSYYYGHPYLGRPFYYGPRFFGPCYGPFPPYPCW